MDNEQSTSRSVEDQDQPQDMSAGPGQGGSEDAIAERGADSPGDAATKDREQEIDEAKEEVKKLEEDPPE